MKSYTREEEDFIRDNYDTMKIADIATHLGRTSKTIDWKRNQLGIKPNKKRTPEQIVSLIEGKGIRLLSEYTGFNNGILAECPTCKQEWNTRPDNIVYQGDVQCWRCAKKQAGKKNRKGTKYITGSYINKLENNAKLRGHKFEIEADDVESVLIEQDFKCALTQQPIVCPYGREQERTLSVDQIEPGKGYVTGNFQCVTKSVNRMKLDLSQEDFIKWCTLIANHAEGIK